MRPVQSFLERGVQKVRGEKKVPTSKGRWSSADQKKRSLLKLLPKELCGSSVDKKKKEEVLNFEGGRGGCNCTHRTPWTCLWRLFKNYSMYLKCNSLLYFPELYYKERDAAPENILKSSPTLFKSDHVWDRLLSCYSMEFGQVRY